MLKTHSIPQSVCSIPKEDAGPHIGLIDFGLNFPENFRYSSDRTFHDFDILIWKLGPHSLSAFGLSLPMGNVILGSGYNSLKVCENRRSKEFQDFFKKGGLLVVISPEQFYFSSPPMPGRPLHSLIPEGPTFVAGSGDKIEFKGGSEELNVFWENQKQNFKYLGYYTKFKGKPFIWARNSENALGYLNKIENGHILVLPSLSFIISYLEDSSLAKLGGLIAAIKVFHQSIASEQREILPPAWIKQYILPEEPEIQKSVQEVEANISELKQELLRRYSYLTSLRKQKLLLYGKGLPLLIQVIKALQELGIEAVEGPSGRDDLILKYKEYVGVGEVKGTKHTAAEKHAAQLEKWASNYHLNNNIHPKAFLIVNAFNEIDPSQRKNDEAFPGQMMTYCLARNHCLLSTSQLLAMTLVVRRDPSQKEVIAEKLFKTVGVVPGYEIIPELGK